MAKDTKGRGQDAANEPEKSAKTVTNLRFYEEDARVFVDLAALRNLTVAELYRQKHAENDRKELIAETERRLRELKGK